MGKQIAASDYTRPGDPLRIDAGYRPNGMKRFTDEAASLTPAGKDRVPGIPASGRTPLIRMFHAVSLEPGVEMSKVLAFSAAALRSGSSSAYGSGESERITCCAPAAA